MGLHLLTPQQLNAAIEFDSTPSAAPLPVACMPGSRYEEAAMQQAAVSSLLTPSAATVMTLLKILLLVLGSVARVPLSYAAPVSPLDDDQPLESPAADDPSLWAYLGVASALVLLGGAFAGLTIAYVRDKVCQTP